jgi:hypothetical protein
MCGKGKIINVVLNSNNALSGSTNNNASYNIDFSAILKDKMAYHLHWTYVGQANTLTIASKIPQVQVNFVTETYLNRSSTLGAPSTFHIGSLRSAYLNGTLNILYAGDNDNPPVYLANRPYNNTFNVQVLTNDATPVAWTDNAGTPVANNSYILTLSFQEIGNDD